MQDVQGGRRADLLEICAGRAQKIAGLAMPTRDEDGNFFPANAGSHPYLTIFRRVPAMSALLWSLFQLLSLATVVSKSSAIENSVSLRLTR